MPVVSASAVWIRAATSPSVMRRAAAPALRTAAMRSAWRGRSRTSAVISAAGTPCRPREAADVVPRGSRRARAVQKHRQALLVGVDGTATLDVIRGGDVQL